MSAFDPKRTLVASCALTNSVMMCYVTVVGLGNKPMRRREFIVTIGSAAVAWPFATRAESALPVIGILYSGSPEAYQFTSILKGLNEAGYIEGRNVEIDHQSARAQYERLPTLVAHLLDRRVALIVATGFPAALAAKSSTLTIPIVFVTGGDPVEFGLVASLNRPGGNVTGVNQVLGALGPKRLEVLRELVPTATTIAILVNPKNPITDTHLALEKEAARAFGLRVIVASATATKELDRAFAGLVQQAVSALIINDDPLFVSSREQLVALAARHALPTIYFQRLFVTSGGQ
jgi:putative tryptophan/tyrosine transport system substrate-binding protein